MQKNIQTEKIRYLQYMVWCNTIHKFHVLLLCILPTYWFSIDDFQSIWTTKTTYNNVEMAV